MAQQSQKGIIEENVRTRDRRQNWREDKNDCAQDKIDGQPEDMFNALALQEALKIASNLAPRPDPGEMNHKSVGVSHGLQDSFPRIDAILEAKVVVVARM
jgi:hypothetical protein